MRGKALGVVLGLVIVLGLGGLRTAAAPPHIYYITPRIRYVPEHRAYSFYVRALGSGGLEYHWWHQEPDSAVGHEIPDEYGLIIGRARLTVYDALPNRDYNGWYWCVVVNRTTGESSTSPTGQVVVVTAPTITQQPEDQAVPLGGMATFQVAADAGAPVRIHYQWYHNSKPIAGAILPTLTFRYVRKTREGYYTCRVRTIGGYTWSGGAQLIVTPPQ